MMVVVPWFYGGCLASVWLPDLLQVGPRYKLVRLLHVHLQELCRVLGRVVEGGVTLPSQASLELLVPVHLHLHPNLQPHNPHQPLPNSSLLLLLLLLLHQHTNPPLHLLLQDHSTACSLGPCAIFFPPALAAAAVAGTPWMLSGLHRWAAADTPHAGTPHTHTTHPHPGRTAPQPCYN